MRTVVSNPIALFFQRGLTGQREAHNRSRNIRFDGSQIYSYNTAILSTLRDEKGLWYLLNTAYYSPTTAEHQRAVASYLREQRGILAARWAGTSFPLFRSLSDSFRGNFSGNSIGNFKDWEDWDVGKPHLFWRALPSWVSYDEPYVVDRTNKFSLIESTTHEALFRVHDEEGELHRGREHYLLSTRDNTTHNPYHNRTLIILPLGSKPTTISEAYECLKPPDVRAYERIHGSGCLRQGEWFFIPADAFGDVPTRRREDELRLTRIQAGEKRCPINIGERTIPTHFATLVCRDYPHRTLVKGYLTHGDFAYSRPSEHSRLHVPTWHVALKSLQLAAVSDNGTGGAGD